MAIKQAFGILCETAILEDVTKNISIISIFESAEAPSFPVVLPKICIVTRFEGGSGEHQHKIIIRDEAGAEIASLEGKINFGTNSKAQYIGRFIGIPFNRAGEYKINIYVNNEIQPISPTLTLKLLKKK